MLSGFASSHSIYRQHVADRLQREVAALEPEHFAKLHARQQELAGRLEELAGRLEELFEQQHGSAIVTAGQQLALDC
jgi:hypothetical protein